METIAVVSLGRLRRWRWLRANLEPAIVEALEQLGDVQELLRRNPEQARFKVIEIARRLDRAAY